MIFRLRDESVTNTELSRQCPTLRPVVEVTPVDFHRTDDVKTSTVKPVDIAPAEPVFIGEQIPSLQERFRDRFGGIRARIQSRRFQ